MAFRALILAVSLAFGLVGTATAQTSTRVTTDLNMRSGPGTEFPVLRVIPRNSPVWVIACNAAVTWCNINFVTSGWVSANFLTPRPGAPAPLPTPIPPPPIFPAPGPIFPGPGPIFPGPGSVFPGLPGSDRVNVVGTLTTQGAECPTFRGDNGQLYSLIGGTRGFRPGDRVRVRGRIAEMSFCMQGTAVEVRSITPAR